MRRVGPTRYTKSLGTSYETLRGCRCCGGIWNDLRGDAGFDRNVQASIKRRHEPKDGCDYGGVSNPLGLLRFIDSFAPGGDMERHRGAGQFAKCRGILLFRPERETGIKSMNGIGLCT